MRTGRDRCSLRPSGAVMSCGARAPSRTAYTAFTSHLSISTELAVLYCERTAAQQMVAEIWRSQRNAPVVRSRSSAQRRCGSVPRSAVRTSLERCNQPGIRREGSVEAP